ncbi:MAG: hypothetical protein ACLTNQ_15680 [Phocaeicola coprophilus]|uniref:hypothetical protein n=1 Tax=Phocaeicola coprophilus TaxID=387090 RepID=UPI0039930AC8
MKREIIHMEDGRIVIPAVHPDKIRMDEAELVGLFNVVAPTLRAAKKRTLIPQHFDLTLFISS